MAKKNIASGSGALPGVFEVPLSEIHADENFNARKDYSGREGETDSRQTIEELADSILRDGQLQPVLVRKNGKGKLSLVFGFRRFRAMQQLAEGKKTPKGFAASGFIRAQTFDGTDADAACINLAENDARNELHPWERGQAYKKLKEAYAMSGPQIAQRVGKSKGYVNNLIRVFEACHPKILEAWQSGEGMFTTDEMNLLAKRTPEEQLQVLASKRGEVEQADDGGGREPQQAGLPKRASLKKLAAAYEAVKSSEKSKDWKDGARAALLFAMKSKPIPGVYDPTKKANKAKDSVPSDDDE